MTTHALRQPVTVAPNGIQWTTLCGLRVLMPKQKFAAGAQVNVGDGQQGQCPGCFADEEQRPVEQIEAQQRLQDGDPGPVTFDESVGDIESDDQISDIEDDTGVGDVEEEQP